MKQPRRINVNGVDMCWCKRHEAYIECSKFYYRYHNNMYEYECKECISERNRLFKLKNKEGKPTEKELKEIFLRACGYDPESKIPIHEQFLIKHDL